MGKTVVNINGEILDEKEAKISVFDRGFLYGDSVYEVTRSYGPVIFQIDEHLDRLFHSAKIIGLEIPWSRSHIVEEMKKTRLASGYDNVYFRPIVTRGVGEIGLDPHLSLQKNLIIIVKEQKENPTWWYTDGIHLAVVSVLRNDSRALDPNAKSGNYLNNVLAMQEAVKHGAFDAVMLDKFGHVTESTTSNVWMVKAGVVYTPPLQTGLLKGITRETLLKICQENHIPVREQNFTGDDFRKSDEAFITSTTKSVVPVTKVDGEPLGPGKPGPLTQTLLELHQKFIRHYIREHS